MYFTEKTYPYPPGEGVVKWVSTEWLDEHLEDKNLMMLDVQPNVHDYSGARFVHYHSLYNELRGKPRSSISLHRVACHIGGLVSFLLGCGSFIQRLNSESGGSALKRCFLRDSNMLFSSPKNSAAVTTL